MRMNWKGLRAGLILGALLWVLIVMAWARVSHGADYLPVNIPDLYTPAEIAHYQVIRDRAPSRLHGKDLPRWLVSTVLSQSQAYAQPEGSGQRTPLVVLIGYLTDTRNGRIVAIVQTFVHPDTGLRSLRDWVDEGWIKAGKGDGEWRSFTDERITGPMTVAETERALEPVYQAVEAGVRLAGQL